MPSPVGHAVAGLIVALASERPQPRAALAPVPWTLLLVCMVLAALPDLDYVYPPSHRGPTHSIGAAVIATLIAAAVTRWTTGRTSWRIAAVCGLAYFSHVVMDWLGEDPTPTPGVKALWPFTDQLFKSGLDIFRSTKRLAVFALPQLIHNVITLAQEMAILGPILAWLLWRRSRAQP